MLTDATRRDLKQLRFLLEEALARSQQQAEIDRRAAVLLLDGACELSRDVTPQTKYAWSRPHTVFAWSLYLPCELQHVLRFARIFSAAQLRVAPNAVNPPDVAAVAPPSTTMTSLVRWERHLCERVGRVDLHRRPVQPVISTPYRLLVPSRAHDKRCSDDDEQYWERGPTQHPECPASRKWQGFGLG
jgi:hypothetical protein